MGVLSCCPLLYTANGLNTNLPHKHTDEMDNNNSMQRCGKLACYLSNLLLSWPFPVFLLQLFNQSLSLTICRQIVRVVFLIGIPRTSWCLRQVSFEIFIIWSHVQYDNAGLRVAELPQELSQDEHRTLETVYIYRGRVICKMCVDSGVYLILTVLANKIKNLHMSPVSQYFPVLLDRADVNKNMIGTCCSVWPSSSVRQGLQFSSTEKQSNISYVHSQL